VGLARALARNPSLLLLDEPFSALDAPVRARLCRELRTLQGEQALSTVLVTHDPEEAALLADELIVIDQGKALQQGPVDEVLKHPASPRVAALLGVANTYAGLVSAPGVVRAAGLELAARTGEIAVGRPVTWSVRPEDIALNGTGPHRATVLDAVTLGAASELTVQLDSLELTVRTLARPALARGTEVGLELPADAITVWPAASERPASTWPARPGRAGSAGFSSRRRRSDA
jgi:molybdate transport system permease protein